LHRPILSREAEVRNAENEFDAEQSVWKGALAGVIAGFVASWVMNQFQAALRAEPSQPQGESEDATMKAAEAISETIADRHLTNEEKHAAGPIIHYAFGSSLGAAYGALAEVAPRTTTAWGVPFGAAVWFGADEVAVPAFGLSKSPFDYPMSTHASALAAHLVYGITTDLVRRVVRSVI
jgi:uncharacterized membrane protein YagU involved in acid resistance